MPGISRFGRIALVLISSFPARESCSTFLAPQAAIAKEVPIRACSLAWSRSRERDRHDRAGVDGHRDRRVIELGGGLMVAAQFRRELRSTRPVHAHRGRDYIFMISGTWPARPRAKNLISAQKEPVDHGRALGVLRAGIFPPQPRSTRVEGILSAAGGGGDPRAP